MVLVTLLSTSISENSESLDSCPQNTFLHFFCLILNVFLLSSIFVRKYHPPGYLHVCDVTQNNLLREQPVLSVNTFQKIFVTLWWQKGNRFWRILCRHNRMFSKSVIQRFTWMKTFVQKGIVGKNVKNEKPTKTYTTYSHLYLYFLLCSVIRPMAMFCRIKIKLKILYLEIRLCLVHEF